MSSLCVKCKQNIHSESAECVDCLGNFHFECAVNENTYRKVNSRKRTWKCVNCVNLGIKTRSSSTSGITDAMNSNDDLRDIKQTLEVMNKKMDEMYVLKTEIVDLKNSVQYMSDDYDSLTNEIRGFKSEISNLHKKIHEIQKDSELKTKRIEQLEKSLHEMEQYSRMRNLEINGIRETPGENYVRIVANIAKELKLDITEADIDIAHRLSSDKRAAKPILVQFITKKKRDLLLTQKKHIVVNQNIHGTKLGDNIYFNEHLSGYYKNLLRLTKERAKQYGFKFAWFRYGRIMVRKDVNDEVIRISNEEELGRKIGVLKGDQ